MSLGGLIGSALAGGVAGYGASKTEELRKEAEQLRQESMLRMQQQFSRENMMLNDSMQNQRDIRNRGWSLEDQAKAQEEQKIKDAQDATIRGEDRADAWDRAKWQADRADIAASRADARAENKPGEMGRMFKDLSGIYGEEKAKEILQSTFESKKKGQLTPAEMADIRSKAVKIVDDRYKDQLMMAKTPEEQRSILGKMKSESERLAAQLSGQTDPRDEEALGILKSLGYGPGENEKKELIGLSKYGNDKNEVKNLADILKTEEKTNIEEARKRVAKAQAMGYTPSEEDIKILSESEPKKIKPADSIRQKRIDAWEKKNPGKPIPKEILDRGL